MARKDPQRIDRLDASSGTPSDRVQVDHRLALQKQNIWHRRVLFYASIALAGSLYWEFYTFITSESGLKCLIEKTPFALVVASLLGVIPTAIVLSLVTVIFRRSKTDKDGEDDSTMKALDLLSKFASIIKAVR